MRESNPTFLLSRAQRDIEFLLGHGGSMIERSTFGSMIETAEFYAYAKENRLDDRETPKRIPQRNTDCMAIKHQKGEPGYDLDFHTMERLGRANRLLDAVGRITVDDVPVGRLYRRALEAYHGDRGERWGRPEKNSNSGGVGDRFVALYPLTRTGAGWVMALRAKFPLSGELRADEILANEYAAQRTSANEQRRVRLLHCAEQAKALLLSSHEALTAASMVADRTAMEIRRASLAAMMRAGAG